MNEHLSRMDRYGQPNRVKRSSSTSWNFSSGVAAAEPAPPEPTRPEPTATVIHEKVMPDAFAEKKPAIGDETMVRLLIPRTVAPEERRRGKMTLAASKPEPVKLAMAENGKFESAAVAALAKLKEPIPQHPFSTSSGSGLLDEAEHLDEGQEHLLEMTSLESELEMMPTRKELFPSQRLKMTRWFYNSLLYIFVIILIYLLWWGVSDSPWGKNHGL
ncbi:hypothetical protein MKZ15_14070 [Paenibacillus sp. FSL R7-0216]|uniref:hypothetical protein n=1 Tax=Paenibacillus sp. FSL R7-0216 TaxID=2921677 RepID=UPI0030D902C1